MGKPSKISAPMMAELENIAEWERDGHLGCPVDRIPVRTLLALSRRDLIAPKRRWLLSAHSSRT